MAEGPMETERITLSQRERDRLKVLHEVRQRHLTQVEAAARLKVTDRQVRRMLLRIREHGDAALVHGLRGRPSNRKLAARFDACCSAAASSIPSSTSPCRRTSMTVAERYRAQAALLVRVLQFIAAEQCFPLKGGTAINLFIRDMPRISVDLDLTYLPVADRNASLKAIDAAMRRI
jgi:predicted DNA-binding protein (UPF0251 family)